MMYKYDIKEIEKEIFNDPRYHDDVDVFDKLLIEYFEREWEENFVPAINKELQKRGIDLDFDLLLRKLNLLEIDNAYCSCYDDVDLIAVSINDFTRSVNILKSVENTIIISYRMEIKNSEIKRK